MSARRPLRFLIIGAGMAGVLAGIRLQKAGHHDFALYEKAERLGGTWRENTYPGIACDVPAHLYTYSFEPNPDWSHRFAPGDEIEAYFEGVADKYGITPHIRFGEEIAHCEFRDHRWHVRTASGHEDVADVVIAATGVLHHPNTPHFEGIESFAGACFHSACWDHSVPLDGRRVGVIGTGSTAVQITGALVDRVAHFDLYQRTAQWILPQDNPAYTDAEKRAFRERPEVLAAMRDEMLNSFSRTFSNAVIDADSPEIREVQATCQANLDEQVKDPALHAALRPDYRAACKRLIMSENFYDAIQRPNAELVTSPIRCIEPTGVRTEDGRLHETDVLVLATGFRVDRFIRPTEVIGRGGVRLDDAWRDRPLAYLSISIPDFPNLFLLNGPNGPVGNFSLIEIAELQLDYVLQLVDELATGTCEEIVARRDVTDAFEAERVEAAKHTVWTTGCRSWYLDDRGVPASWPFPFDRFRSEMARPKPEAFERA